jgi:hypothetical protein
LLTTGQRLAGRSAPRGIGKSRPAPDQLAGGRPLHEAGVTAAELSEVLAANSGPDLSWPDVESHLIYENAPASATAGIWRVGVGDWSVVVKVLRQGREGSPAWQSGAEISHWYYWRREAQVYSSGSRPRRVPQDTPLLRCVRASRQAR